VFGTPSETGAWACGSKASPDAVDRGARRTHCCGHAVGRSPPCQPRHQRTACRTGHAEGRGGAGAAAGRRSQASVQARARKSDTALRDIMSVAGRERANCPGGRSCGGRAFSAQRDLLWQLVETYAVAHLAGPLADAQKARVRSGDREPCISRGTDPTRRKQRSATA